MEIINGILKDFMKSNNSCVKSRLLFIIVIIIVIDCSQ